MPKPYALQPNWQWKTEYHICRYRDCREQSAFVITQAFNVSIRDPQMIDIDHPIEYVYLCPLHSQEIETVREDLTSLPDGESRFRSWLAYCIRSQSPGDLH